ncbi:EMB514 (DUF3223) [Tasmannia lanceolata]|uniref:EMB514 (DUF3223) n=1 Tax=Tasmannia lanceolata TaxID=3420 RepID=UPI0040644D9E
MAEVTETPQTVEESVPLEDMDLETEALQNPNPSESCSVEKQSNGIINNKENGESEPSSKRSREEQDEAEEGEKDESKKAKTEKSVEEKRLEEMEVNKEKGDLEKEEEEGKEGDREEKEVVEIHVGPKVFGSSVEMFEYFYKFLHFWPNNVDVNKYEHMMLLDLLKKGHLEPEKKIGRGIRAFQIRDHPLFKSRCFFLIREDGFADDFSFRKCIDKIIPLPDNMKAPGKGDADKKSHGGGRGGGGRGGRGGRGRGRRGGFRK